MIFFNMVFSSLLSQLRAGGASYVFDTWAEFQSKKNSMIYLWNGAQVVVCESLMLGYDVEKISIVYSENNNLEDIIIKTGNCEIAKYGKTPEPVELSDSLFSYCKLPVESVKNFRVPNPTFFIRGKNNSKLVLADFDSYNFEGKVVWDYIN